MRNVLCSVEVEGAMGQECAQLDGHLSLAEHVLLALVESVVEVCESEDVGVCVLLQEEAVRAGNELLHIGEAKRLVQLLDQLKDEEQVVCSNFSSHREVQLSRGQCEFGGMRRERRRSVREREGRKGE